MVKIGGGRWPTVAMCAFRFAYNIRAKRLNKAGFQSLPTSCTILFDGDDPELEKPGETADLHILSLIG